ncbi:hypothetical protein [Microbacterium sp. SLBN-111]|uniref:hypothetical protein n=1 Tax=Microbacterium sp. SLBN-111 TaxID=3377733 RepID=UPI003C74B23E
MSGPYDVPDDPDDVTLWAGRLRAWPTPPTVGTGTDEDEVDEDTAISARPVADDTVRVRRQVPPDDTVRVDRPAPADDTVRVDRPAPVPAPADDTVRVDRPAPVPAPADDTVRVDRPAPVPAPADDTVRVDRPAPPVDETTAPGRRRGGDAAPAETSTADTAAGTRRARRSPEVPTTELPSGDPAPRPRDARVPSGEHELYRPRVDEAARVTRAAPPARPDDAPDAAEVRPRTPRRTRTRAIVLAVTVVVLVAAAAVALFLLMG